MHNQPLLPNYFFTASQLQNRVKGIVTIIL